MQEQGELNAGPGWYHLPKDPPDTVRYWNGLGWSPPHQVGGDDRIFDAGVVAPWSHRIAARAIDLVLANAIGLTVSLFTRYRVDARSTDWTIDFAYQSVAAVLAVFVWETFWLAMDAATPGKQVMKLWVINERQPQRSLGWRALARNLHRALYVVPLLLVSEPARSWSIAAGVAFAIGALSVCLAVFDSPLRRTPADLLAGTSVRRAPESSLRFRGWVLQASAILLPALIGGAVWIHQTNHEVPERVAIEWLELANGPQAVADELRTELCGVRSGAFEVVKAVPLRTARVISTELMFADEVDPETGEPIAADGDVGEETEGRLIEVLLGPSSEESRERRANRAVVIGEATFLVDRAEEAQAFEVVLVTSYDEERLEPVWKVCGFTLAPDLSGFLPPVDVQAEAGS